jgi:hypothetical protein
MINAINPEFTRQALQTKYGTPNGFKYLEPVPIFLTWDASNYVTNPDYITIRTQVNTYCAFVGLLTVVTDSSHVGAFSFNLFAPSTTPITTLQKTINNSADTSTNPSIINSPWQTYLVFNSGGLLNVTGRPQFQFSFLGFYIQKLGK